MSWTIRRYRYGETVTDGLLKIADHARSYPTLERPWLPGKPGGMPNVSCVPDGKYQLIRHTRPNGDLVLALRNPDLDVYYDPGQLPAEGGRCLVLLHAGNYIDDIEGCIAPGLTRVIHQGRPMVQHSRSAMKEIMYQYDLRVPKELLIETQTGAY